MELWHSAGFMSLSLSQGLSSSSTLARLSCSSQSQYKFFFFFLLPRPQSPQRCAPPSRLSCPGARFKRWPPHQTDSADWWLGFFKHGGAQGEGGNEVGGWRLRLPPPPFLCFRSSPAYPWFNSNGLKRGAELPPWDSDDLYSVCTVEEVGHVKEPGLLWRVSVSLLPPSASPWDRSLHEDTPILLHTIFFFFKHLILVLIVGLLWWFSYKSSRGKLTGTVLQVHFALLYSHLSLPSLPWVDLCVEWTHLSMVGSGSGSMASCMSALSRTSSEKSLSD